jgi:protein TonB
MGIVAGMHAAVIFVVAGALVIKQDAPPESMTATVIDDPEPIIEPTPAPRPDIATIDLYVPKPVDLDFETEPPGPPDVIRAQELPPGGDIVGGGSAEPMPVIQDVRQDPRRPLTQPYYPPSEIRAGNEGNADIEVYVLPNGRVADARIIRSTGHSRLDQSAIEEAKKNWRLIPATRDGVAIAQWHRLRVVFQLKKD